MRIAASHRNRPGLMTRNRRSEFRRFRRPLTDRVVGDAHPVLGLGVLDARLHSGDIVRLWTIPVSVSRGISRRWLPYPAAIVRLRWAGVNGASGAWIKNKRTRFRTD